MCHVEPWSYVFKIWFLVKSYIIYLDFIRFMEGEDDCTEALNLDDRYIKAYSCRITTWKELGKVKEAKDGIPCSNPSVFVFSIINFFHFLNIDLYCTPIMCIDAEFAISLDPNNEELRKQHSTANGKIRFIVFQKKHHTRLFPNNTNDHRWTDNSENILPN